MGEAQKAEQVDKGTDIISQRLRNTEKGVGVEWFATAVETWGCLSVTIMNLCIAVMLLIYSYTYLNGGGGCGRPVVKALVSNVLGK